jgi:hypothetical protein
LVNVPLQQAPVRNSDVVRRRPAGVLDDDRVGVDLEGLSVRWPGLERRDVAVVDEQARTPLQRVVDEGADAEQRDAPERTQHDLGRVMAPSF